MNAKAWMAAAMVASVLAVRAEEQPAQAEPLSPEMLRLHLRALDWDDPRWWEAMRAKEPPLTIGRSGYAIEGPLTKGFRRPANWSDLTPLEKISSLPVIGWFIPQQMPMAPNTRPRLAEYIKWGETDQPWSNISDPWISRPALLSVSY